MKKYVYLLLSTLLIVGVITMSGYMIKGTSADVEVTILSKRSVDNTITAGGRLQYRSGKQVRSKAAGIMGTVNVSNGDAVKKGDELYSFYKIDEAYTAMLSQYSGLGGLEAVFGAASMYASPSELVTELKKHCSLETVVSEAEGRVTDISFGADEIFEKNALIMKISEENSLEVPVNISENYIGSISIGQKAEVKFNAIPDRVFGGKVTKIADEAAVTSGLTGKETTVEVTVTLDKGDKELKAGYSASCTIKLSTDENVIVLPYELLRSDDGGDYVYLAIKNKAHKRYVTIGKEYKNGAGISEGLSQGDAVINNSEGLTDGNKVTITRRTVQEND